MLIDSERGQRVTQVGAHPCHLDIHLSNLLGTRPRGQRRALSERKASEASGDPSWLSGTAMSPSIRFGLRASSDEGGANVPREGGETAWQEAAATKVMSNKRFIFVPLSSSHVNTWNVGFSLDNNYQRDGVSE